MVFPKDLFGILAFLFGNPEASDQILCWRLPSYDLNGHPSNVFGFVMGSSLAHCHPLFGLTQNLGDVPI